MTSPRIVVLVACILVVQQGILALPRMSTRQFASVNYPTRVVRENVCKNYMETCVPWETSCCNNMECMNLARGYCLFPLEKCVCQKVSSDIY
ncbi:unnamed protein product [Candidula unifasciata]|uniref:Uncharacterized protein n=1 Tax=Candidula unifasciata TaxID=100452 RepID=A0A8S4A4K5_9EUPU|nr:unnamed protein product [Candidula unifasciata]